VAHCEDRIALPYLAGSSRQITLRIILVPTTRRTVSPSNSWAVGIQNSTDSHSWLPHFSQRILLRTPFGPDAFDELPQVARIIDTADIAFAAAHANQPPLLEGGKQSEGIRPTRFPVLFPA
jgi:hypothetical protein